MTYRRRKPNHRGIASFAWDSGRRGPPRAFLAYMRCLTESNSISAPAWGSLPQKTGGLEGNQDAMLFFALLSQGEQCQLTQRGTRSQHTGVPKNDCTRRITQGTTARLMGTLGLLHSTPNVTADTLNKKNPGKWSHRLMQADALRDTQALPSTWHFVLKEDLALAVEGVLGKVAWEGWQPESDVQEVEEGPEIPLRAVTAATAGLRRL